MLKQWEEHQIKKKKKRILMQNVQRVDLTLGDLYPVHRWILTFEREMTLISLI